MDIDLDRELKNHPEYRRILAELSSDERLRLLGMDLSLQRQLVRKREYRRQLAKLPPSQKLRILEELRRRVQMLKGSRRSNLPPPTPSTSEVGQDRRRKGSDEKRTVRLKAGSDRFGGRATVGGVNYEARVAAFIAVRMLSGNQCSVWEGIDGADVSAITLQAPGPVDDIVVSLRGDIEARAFISAKERSGAIALTAKSRPFSETVDGFVRQFLELSPEARTKSRFVWAIPSCVGRAVTHDLPDVLDTHRMDAGDDSLSDFLCGREGRKKKTLGAFLTVATQAWKKHSGNSPTEDELRFFLRQVYVEVYDFECGQRLERQAQSDIRSHIIADPKKARRMWEKLEHFFTRADQRGLRATPASLRRELASDGLRLKSPPDYAEDIARLRELTARNLSRLKKHTILPFGPKPAEGIHIPRKQELSALLAAAQSGHLLITGEPGCGKSGLIHELVEALETRGLPVVLLLAEELSSRDWKGSARLPGFAHSLDEALANWPDGAHGFFITDALDAIRDVETQKMLRRLLRDVQKGQSGWKVIASVREYDLKHGRELREAFPGTGVAGHFSIDFAGVAHFYLTRLCEDQLDELATRRAEIRPFIESARKSTKSGEIHRSPFYLRLAVELLRDGANPSRLADWNSPAVLLRKFWSARIKGGSGEGEREVVLEAICRQMVDTRSMTISLKELSLASSVRPSVDELRGRGILQTPSLRHGTLVGGDEIRFTHHLLHDYAIARSLIPETHVPFCRFVSHNPLLPIFYRQSFMFALEELWDAPDGRNGFWESTLKLENSPQLHGITRLLAPVLAAKRVEAITDLEELLAAVATGNNVNTPAHKALLHLASGLQDASPAAIRAGAAGWCTFAEQLASLLPSRTFIEGALVNIVARLNAVGAASDAAQRLSLSAAARCLLAYHTAKDVSKGWRHAAFVAIEAVCRTFSIAPKESEDALLSLLTPQRLAQFPHDDLHDMAENLKHLSVEGEAVVIRLFEAAFAAEPPPGNWHQFGTAILPMQMQTSDQWNAIHYVLAEYYHANTSENAAMMTEAACIAWNAVVRRRGDRGNREEHVLATILFRGVPCKLVEDYSHVWGREFEHEENRILSHFEKLLRVWAAAGDTAKLNAALDCFAVRNRTSLMWTVFMEAGAEHPSTLGLLLEGLLSESLFLTHADYVYGGTALLGALHKTADPVRREQLEKLILDLPMNVRLRKEEGREPAPLWVEHAQNRLLGALEESNIVLGATRALWQERRASNALSANQKPQSPSVVDVAEEEREISPKNTANEELFHLREALKPFQNRDNNKVDVKEIDSHWPIIEQCERALKRHKKHQPKMADELWGHLVGACETIARVATWVTTSKQWTTVRRILLKAADDPVPRTSDDEDAKEDRWPSWGWPSPRVDAARGLPFLVLRLGEADKAMTRALRKLCRDKSHPVRFNLAFELALLEKPAPNLMWNLIDAFVANERKFSVLDAVLHSIDGLWTRTTETVLLRIQQIAKRVADEAPAKNGVHETLAQTYLFEYLRTGRPECDSYLSALIADCDRQPANHAILAQLHACRAGGWMTAGAGIEPNSQADAVRKRTWGFLLKLLKTAQDSLKRHREAWEHLREHGQADAEKLKVCQEQIDQTARLVDGIATQLWFASGAHEEKTNKYEVRLSGEQTQRFWEEAKPLLRMLADEPHPHTAYQFVQTLRYLLPCAPREAFLLATQAIRNSSSAGFQYESLAVGEVVKLIQRALADHREIFQSDGGRESDCLVALLQVLDLFVEAGWSEARQLTHRLEEIYR